MATIDKTYHSLLENILKEGFKYEDPNRKGVNRIQIPTYTFKHDFKDGFPAITTKKLFWKGVVGELLWFLRGDANIKYLVDNGINIWNKDAYNYHLSKGYLDCDNLEEYIDNVKNAESWVGDLGRVYGAQWRQFISYNQKRKCFVVKDQISNLIKGLKENPMGTRHIVTAWNPAELDDMALPPCHWSFEILVEPYSFKQQSKFAKKNLDSFMKGSPKNIPEYQFTLKWHQRSVDTFLGAPFNIASYALLAYIIGKLTGMVPKGIIGDLSNVHIYEPHIDAVKKQLSRSVNMHNSRCELEDFSGFKMDMNFDLDQWLGSKEISDFNLTPHTEQSAIKAEMLPYS